MHLHPFRASVGAPRRHWLQFWVLLLLAPACFALATMPMTMAAVAITLSFGLPFGIWLALNAHSASALRARAVSAVRFAAGACVTCLGLFGTFAFSVALGCAALAAYVVTVGLMAARGGTRSTARPALTAAPTHETPTVVTLDNVREMTDAELCHAWRHSFVALQQASGVHLRAMVVQTRQWLLDEVDARHPEGLRAWLTSGAQAAGGPDRFIGHTEDDGQSEAA